MKHQQHPVDQGDTGEWFVGIATDIDATAPIQTIDPFPDAPGLVVDRSPMPMAPPRRHRAGRRWTAMLIGAVVIVWLLVWLLPQIPQRQAADVSARYRVALDALGATLPGADVAAQAVADPGIATDRLGGVVPGITVLGQAADTITELAAEPLPKAPPLVPAGPLGDLVTIRSRMGMIGPEADAAAKHINAVLSYRTLAYEILDTGPLPTTPDTAELNSLSVLLASTYADATGILGALPDVASLTAHRAMLDGAVARFEFWQVEYLDALRRSDTDAATTLVAELSTLRGALATALDDALAETGDALDAALIALEASITAARAILGG